MASVTTPTINKIIRLNNYDLLGTKCKKYNMYMCLDTLQLWYDESDTKRTLYGYVGVDTVNDLKNNLIPEFGVTYYCWESNSLWLWMNRWICIYTDNKYPSAYRTDNDYIEAVYLNDQQPTIVDNNGLLRDGSVVIRDANRIIKGRLYVSDTQDNLVISSYLGGGVRLLPNGAFSTDGELYIDDDAKSHIRGEWNVLNNEIYVDYKEKPDSDKNEFRDSTHRYRVWHEGNLKLSSFDLTGENIYNKLIDAQKDGTLPDPLELNVSKLNGLKSTDFALKTHIHKSTDISDFKTASQANASSLLIDKLTNMNFKGARITYDSKTEKYTLSTNNFVLTYTGGATGQGTVTNNSNTSIALTVDPTKHVHQDLIDRIKIIEDKEAGELDNYYNKQETEDLLADMFSATPEEGKALLVDKDGNLPANALTASDLDHDTRLELLGDILGDVTFGYDKTHLTLTTDASPIVSDTPEPGKALKLDADGNLPTKSYSSKKLDHNITVKLIGDVEGNATLDTATNSLQITTKIGSTAENAVPWSAVGRDVASLVDGRVPLAQLPEGIMSSLKLVGMWNGSSVPTTTPEEGQAWVIASKVTIGGKNYNAGDWIYYYNSSWNRADLGTSVKSVNGVSGENITLDYSHMGAISDDYINYIVGATIPANKIVVTDKNGHIAGATVDKLTNNFKLLSTAGDVTFASTSKNTSTDGTKDFDVTMNITNTGYTNIADKLRRDIYVNGTQQPFKKDLNFTGRVNVIQEDTGLILDFSDLEENILYFDGSSPANSTFLTELTGWVETKDTKPFYIAFMNNGSVHFIPINNSTTIGTGDTQIQSSENTVIKNSASKLTIKTSKGKITKNSSGSITAFSIVNASETYETLPLAGGTMKGHIYLDGVREHSYNSTSDIVFGNSTTQYAVIRTNTSKSLVISDSVTSNANAVVFAFGSKEIRPETTNQISLGTSSQKWSNVYATTFNGALSGNASSSTYATNARITNTNPTTGTWYKPVWVSGYTANTNYPLLANDGLEYFVQQGTTSANGRALLKLGNATASGTAGNKYGEIRIYNTSTGYTSIVGTASTTNRTITLPNASGTVSLVGHTHNNIVSRGNVTAESGTANSAVSGLSMSQAYNNGYATTYGNVITAKGSGHGQLLMGWSGTSGVAEHLYYRNKRDTSDANWSSWVTILDSNNFGSWAAAKSHTHDYAASNHTHSGYAASSHTHSYLPLSGGTLTGAVSSNSAISTSSTLSSQGHKIYIQTSAPTSGMSTGDIWIDI